MIPSALLRLVWMKMYAAARRMLRVQRNPKKLVLLIVGIVAVGAWLGPMVVLNLTTHRTPTNFIELYGPLALALFTVFSLLASSGEHAIAFQPPEVELLFPAPFTRRQLLAYKMLSGMVGSLGGALIFSILFMRHAGSWATSFAAFLMALWCLQFLGTGVALVKQIVGEKAYTRARRVAIVAALAAAGGVAALMVSRVSIQSVANLEEVVREINQSAAGQVLLAPFRVYAEMAGARTFVEALPWAGIALAINVGLAGVVLRLDADYSDAAIRASERHAERLKRAKSGAMFAPRSGVVVKSRRARMPAWLGEAAPVLWRQTTTLQRGGRKWLLQIAAMMVFVVVMLQGVRGANAEGMEQGVGVAVLAYMTVILAAMLRFDFRADLDHIETLKSLPLSAMGIVVGELLLPVIMLGAVQWMIIAGIAIFFGWPLMFLIGSLMLTPVVNFLVVGMENLLFLMFPARLTNRGVADFSLMGRQMLLFLGKALVYGVIAAVAVGAALGVRAVTGSMTAGLVAAWVVLVAASVGVVAGVSRVFKAFDVSADMPG